MNKMIAMGRITHDLELKTTPNGVPYLKFRIAVDRSYQKSGEEKKADFFNAIAWRNTAEFIARYFGKGRLILIEGELQTTEYTDKNGNKSTWYEISVDHAEFTGERKDDAAQGSPVSGGNYQQSPQNYQTAPNYQANQAAQNYKAAVNNQQAAEMAAIAAKYAGGATAAGTAAAAPPPAPVAPAVPMPQTAPPNNGADDTYPF